MNLPRTHALVLATLIVLPSAATGLAAQEADYETTRIGDGIYMFRYESHNAMFVVTDAGVVAFDPISRDAARIYREEIRRVTDRPIHRIVYSHHHADHITGARELADAPIIAHARAYEHLAANPDPAIPLPDITFTDRMTLRLGDRTIRLLYLGRNHSDNSIVGHLPEERLIFAVDFVANDRVGYRDLPDFYLPGLWESLERLQQIDYGRAVFGHGPPGRKSDVYEQIHYWTDVRSAVESAIEAGRSEDEAVADIDLPEYRDWGGYQDWFPMNVRTVYRHYAGE